MFFTGVGSQFLTTGTGCLVLALVGTFNIHKHGQLNTAAIILYAFTSCKYGVFHRQYIIYVCMYVCICTCTYCVSINTRSDQKVPDRNISMCMGFAKGCVVLSWLPIALKAFFLLY